MEGNGTFANIYIRSSFYKIKFMYIYIIGVDLDFSFQDIYSNVRSTYKSSEIFFLAEKRLEENSTFMKIGRFNICIYAMNL